MNDISEFNNDSIGHKSGNGKENEGISGRVKEGKWNGEGEVSGIEYQ